jgi:H+-transporting ATPase
MMYLTLSVAGHLTIFLARTRGPFWSIRPARVLWLAVLGTQLLATLIAVGGLFMTPLAWRFAALVWGYAIVCFLVSDRIKLLAYRILDPAPLPTPAQDGAVRRQAAVGEPAVAPFHTDTDPEDPVYHDNRDCPYGKEIMRNANSKPGNGGRRRCEWCAEHASDAPPLGAKVLRR